MYEDSIPRRRVLQTGALASAGIWAASGPVTASSDPKTDKNQKCDTYDPYFGRAEFYKGALSQSVHLVSTEDDLWGRGTRTYFFRAAATSTEKYYEQGDIFDEQKYSAEEFCSEDVEWDQHIEDMSITIDIENDNSNVGLYIPDGSIGVGGSPHQLLWGSSNYDAVSDFETLASATISAIPILGTIVDIGKVVGAFGTKDTPTVGDNKQTFDWSFTNYQNAPDDVPDTSCTGYVEFAIRAPKDVSPRFTVKSEAVGAGTLSIDNKYGI